MKYQIETTTGFDREFRKLDKYTQRMLKGWIEKNLVGCEDPYSHGKGLTANRSGQWRYCVGDYRIICEISDTIQMGDESLTIAGLLKNDPFTEDVDSETINEL